MASCVRDNLIYAGLALGAIVLVIIVSLVGSATGFGGGGGGGAAAANRVAGDLLRAAALAVETSRQDKSPVMAVVHAQQGVDYLEAARRIVPDAALERMLDVRLDEFTTLVRAQSQRALGAIGANKEQGLAGAYASMFA